MIYTDLAFMAGVVSICEQCEGRRFTDEVLTYELRGKNISDVLPPPTPEFMIIRRNTGVSRSVR
ncbi:MAG: hypothetical protein ACR2JK_09870, partial [Geodermatophilaceae bacterium]